ncbi:hypothetical protein LIER_08170 [Lithospermum erythrorhizon]|uniref:Uncharacterized protein n=1 Tax=Lithospermum erythrorhizon TaxID=34254 RepID=A0AAV3PDR2_LITER
MATHKGVGGVNDPSISPTHNDSPIRAIDAGALHQANLFLRMSQSLRRAELIPRGVPRPRHPCLLPPPRVKHLDLQLNKINWLNITIFQVECSRAGVEASVPLFSGLFSIKHRDFDISLGAKGGGKLSKNFLAGPSPNKVHTSRWHDKWFLIRACIGPKVPTVWTSKGELTIGGAEAYYRGSASSAFVPIFPPKRSSTSEASDLLEAKRIKVEAVKKATSLVHAPKPLVST